MRNYMKTTLSILLFFFGCIVGPVMTVQDAGAEYIDAMELNLNTDIFTYNGLEVKVL